MNDSKREFHSFSRGAAILYGVGAAILLNDAHYRLAENGTTTEDGLTVSVDVERYIDKYRYIDVREAIEVLNERTPVRFRLIGSRLRITDISEGGEDE